MPALYLAIMDVTAAPDTCPACGTLYALANLHGAYRCAECGNTWRATPYSAYACLLCSGATGRRVGRHREWMACTGCGGTGMRPDAHGKDGSGGQCRGNSGGPHSKIPKNGPAGEKWQCQLCKVRW